MFEFSFQKIFFPSISVESLEGAAVMYVCNVYSFFFHFHKESLIMNLIRVETKLYTHKLSHMSFKENVHILNDFAVLSYANTHTM